MKLFLIVLGILALTQAKTLYFSIPYHDQVGWCDLDTYNLTECSAQTSHFQNGWGDGTYGAYSKPVLLSYQSDVYVLNGTGTSINVFLIQASGATLSVKEVTTLTTPSSFSTINFANYLPNYRKGRDMILAGTSHSNYTTHANSLSFYLIDVATWEIVDTYANIANESEVSSLYAGDTLYFASVVYESNPIEWNTTWQTIMTYEFKTGQLQTLFKCTPEMPQYCQIKGLNLDETTGRAYFSIGWGWYTFSLDDPTDVTPLYIEDPNRAQVSGEYYTSLIYDNIYWYFDALGNLNYIPLSGVPVTHKGANAIGLVEYALIV